MSKLIYIILFVSLFQVAYSSEIFTCSYEQFGTCSDDETLFFASSNLSGNVRLDSNLNYESNYDYSVCCKSNVTLVKFSTKMKNLTTDEITCDKNSPLLYFTGNTNSRVAKEYNPIHHKYGLCYDVPDKTYALSINFVPKEGIIKEFECLFRTSSIVNGVVSSCDSTYDSGNFYEYSVVGDLFSGMDVLSCNFDCSNKLTGRIDYSCSLKMPDSCSAVPIQCSSSLPNSWVSFNETHEVQCSSPWNNFRSKAFTTEALVIETSAAHSCENLIKIPRSVFYNNEVVTMSIFVCQD